MSMFRLRTLASLSIRNHTTLSTTALHLRRSCSQGTHASFRHISSNASKPLTCPSCSSPLPTSLPVCPRCSYIAPIPESITYHEILGQPYEPNPFIVDPTELKRQFRAVQTVVHPDRWVKQPPEEQAIAAAMSSKVNEAFHRISIPLKRVEYILAQEGYAGEETDKMDDNEFLMEVMEAREGLANAESREEILEIRAENEVKVTETLQEIGRLVETKNWQALRGTAVKLKYLEGIDSAASSWLRDH